MAKMGRDLRNPSIDIGLGRGLEVESKKGLGVRRAEVEPPLAHIDRETIEAVLVRVLVDLSNTIDHGKGVFDLGVYLT